jgi:hypothetical protein
VHHLIFLLPHAGTHHENQKEGQEDDHAATKTVPPSPSPRSQGPAAASRSFTLGSPQDETESDNMETAHREFWELRSTPDVAPIQHDEIASIQCVVANVIGMLCVCLVPYCVNGTVTWKGLPHAATFPVFCLGIVVALYASVMFVVLRFMPGEDIAARQQARQALWLLYPTAALLGLLAIVTDGSWSIDAIVLVSP